MGLTEQIELQLESLLAIASVSPHDTTPNDMADHLSCIHDHVAELRKLIDTLQEPDYDPTPQR